jgi:16S rRNA (uracil1498-N3)-methyltransferase
MEPAELVDNLGPPESREDLFLALWAQEGRQGLIPVLQQAAESVKRLVIVVGPEGGLHEDELHLLKQAGFVPVSFGPRILRAETAAIAGLSVVLSRLGDLGSVQS